MNLTYRDRGKARDEIVEQIAEHQDALQYMVTLQTKLKPAATIDLIQDKVMNLSAEFRHFQNRLNYELFGSRTSRKPKSFCVLSVPIIEGFDKSAYGFHTLHYHVALGNIPEHVSQDALETWIKDAWRRTKYGKSDVNLKVVRDDHKTYITKEVLKNEGCGIDWLNLSIPILTLQPQS